MTTHDGEACVVISHGIDEVCTPEEARAVEQAWADGYEKVRRSHPGPEDEMLDAAFKAANVALEEALAKIVRGERMAVAQTAQGCSG